MQLRTKFLTVAMASILTLPACSGDSADEATLGEGSHYGRLTSLSVPENQEEARGAGCTLMGNYLGTGLNSLANLSGGLDQSFDTGRGGIIQLVLLAELENWGNPGENTFNLNLFQGGQDESTLDIITQKPASAPAEDIGAFFSEMVADSEGWFDGYTESLRLPVPILDDLVLYAGMDNTSLTAKAEITEDGAAINGLLMGYLSANSIMEITKSIINACAPGDQPTICPIIGNQITYETPPEEAFPIVVSFMGGYDARLSATGTPEFCELTAEEDSELACNAVSMCLAFGVEPVLPSR
jgi:hypothetical protein